jgi:Tol biopolymer transport system component
MSIARRLIIIIAGLATVVSGACRQIPPPPTPALRLALSHPAELADAPPSSLFGLALSPDGRRLAYPAASADAPPGATDRTLWIRDLSTDTSQPLAGTTGAAMPFWSPDGTAIAFFAEGTLRSLTPADGRIQDLAEAPSPRGGAWHPDGDIVFAPRSDGPLMRRKADGAIEPLTTLESGESSHRFPAFMADGHLVFFVRAEVPTRQGVWIAARDQPQARRRLVSSDAAGLVLDNALVYASGEALVAQRIDRETLMLSGRPELLGAPVGRSAEHQLLATIGGEVLVFGAPPLLLRELRWVDRNGMARGTLGEPMNASDLRLAPSGTQVAVARVDPQLRTLDIWVYEDRRPVPRRLSTAIGADDSPAWSPDGTHVAWVSGQRLVMMRDARAERAEITVRKFDSTVRVSGWSADGRWIVLSESRSGSGTDIVLLAAPNRSRSAPGEVQTYAQAPFNQTYAVVSPDGKWLAYASDESGGFEIYVDSFPTPGRRARLSVGGGTEPRWARDGMHVYFRRDSDVHFVTLSFADGRPEALASERLFGIDRDLRAFDVTSDGQRVLLNIPAPTSQPPTLTALVHVRSLLPSAP